jgi:hypothetical protein
MASSGCSLSVRVCDHYPSFFLDVETCSCVSVAEHVGSVYYVVMSYYFLMCFIFAPVLSWYLWPRIREARRAKEQTKSLSSEWAQHDHRSQADQNGIAVIGETAVSKLRRLSTISRNLAAKLEQDQAPGPGPGDPHHDGECESESDGERRTRVSDTRNDIDISDVEFDAQSMASGSDSDPVTQSVGPSESSTQNVMASDSHSVSTINLSMSANYSSSDSSPSPTTNVALSSSSGSQTSSMSTSRDAERYLSRTTSMASPSVVKQQQSESWAHSLVAESETQTVVSKFITYMLIASLTAVFTFFIRAFDPMSAAGRIPFAWSRFVNNTGSLANIYVADLGTQLIVGIVSPKHYYHPYRHVLVNCSRMFYVIALIAATASGIVLEHLWLFMCIALFFFCCSLARILFDVVVILWTQYNTRHLITQQQLMGKISFDDNGSGRILARVKQGSYLVTVSCIAAIMIGSGAVLSNLYLAVELISELRSSSNPEPLPAASTWVTRQLIYLLQPLVWCLVPIMAHYFPIYVKTSANNVFDHEYAVIRPRVGTVDSQSRAPASCVTIGAVVAPTTPRSQNSIPLDQLDSKLQQHMNSSGIIGTSFRETHRVTSAAPGLLWQGSMGGPAMHRNRSQTAVFVAPSLTSTPHRQLVCASPYTRQEIGSVGAQNVMGALAPLDSSNIPVSRAIPLRRGISGSRNRMETETSTPPTNSIDTSPFASAPTRNPSVDTILPNRLDNSTESDTALESGQIECQLEEDSQAHHHGKEFVNKVQQMLAKNYIVQKSQSIHRATRPIWIALRNLLFVLDFGSDLLLFFLLLQAAHDTDSDGLYAAAVFVIIFVAMPYVIIAYMMFFKIFFVVSRVYASVMQLGDTPVHRALRRARAQGSRIRLSQSQIFAYTLHHYPLPTLGFIACYVILCIPLFVLLDAALGTYFLFQSVTHRPLLSFYQQSRHITQLAFESCPQVVLQLFLLAFNVQTSQTGVNVLVYSFLATVLSILRNMYSVYAHARKLGIPRLEYVKYVLSAGSRSQGIPLLQVPHIDAMRNNQAVQVTFQRITSLVKLKLVLDEVARCKNCHDVNLKDCNIVMKEKSGMKLLCSYFSSGDFMHIRRLSLIRCGLTDDDIFRLSTVADWYGKIRVLRLDGNNDLSDSALRYIAHRLIRNNSELAYLSLRNCAQFTTSGLRDIADASQYSSFLVQVSVDEPVRIACDANVWQALEHQLQLTGVFAVMQLSVGE